MVLMLFTLSNLLLCRWGIRRFFDSSFLLLISSVSSRLRFCATTLISSSSSNPFLWSMIVASSSPTISESKFRFRNTYSYCGKYAFNLKVLNLNANFWCIAKIIPRRSRRLCCTCILTESTGTDWFWLRAYDVTWT